MKSKTSGYCISIYFNKLKLDLLNNPQESRKLENFKGISLCPFLSEEN